MRIGIVTDWSNKGAGNVSKTFLRVLESQGNSVFIYARPGIDEKSYIFNSSNIYNGKRSISNFPKALNKRDLLRWAKLSRLDMVIFNEQIWMWPVFWVKEKGIKVAAYIDYYTESTIELFEVYDLVICNTQRHYNVFKDHRNAVYLPWGVDLQEFRRPIFAELFDSETIFFHSSGVSPFRKGTDLFLRALATNPNFRGAIHIQNELSFYNSQFVKLVVELQKSGQLNVLVGQIEHPYSIGNVYVYPSRLDGIGLSLLEATASGMAIITTDENPMNEFCCDRNALLIDVEKVWARSDGYYWPMSQVSVEALAASMEKLNSDPKMRLSMQKNSIEYSNQNLDIFKNLEPLTKILNEIVYEPVSRKLLKKCSENISQNYFPIRNSIFTSITIWMYRATKCLFRRFL